MTSSWHVRLSILWYATLLHATWALLALFSNSALGATPLALLATLFPGHVHLGLWLLGVSSCAFWGLCLRVGYKRTLLLLPQQVFLLTSAIGGAVAVAQGHYADGTVRPSLFILADQLPIMLAAVVYVLAVWSENGYHYALVPASSN